MVSLLYFSATIPIILFFPQFVSSATSVTFLINLCDNQFNYTNNSGVFQNNLNHLLTNLSSQTLLTNFYNSTFGRDENTVYALGFCPAYIAAKDCQACVQYASHSITKCCPNQKKAIIYYVECVVRYANYSFFSTEENQPDVYSHTTISLDNPDRSDQVLANTMDGLITKAAFGSSTTETKTKFATGEAKINGSQQLYCFMQCTPDITANTCNNCLQYALDNLRRYNYGKEWGLYYIPNCQARYHLVAFYEVVPPPSLPPSATTENTTINTTGPPPPLQPSSGKKRKTSVTFITTITLAAILVILVVFVGNYLITGKVKSSGEATESMEVLEKKYNSRYSGFNIDDSTSFSLSLPSHPAFLLPERQGQGNLSHEFNSMTELDESETKSTQVSTNDVTITELVAR
ncbi:Cysteine-rich receptor-like protein kinase 25 [Camellia lanceoleosa]|uniref:Cysteine-rich receptor-like protein kinase 25 n=1 Tax=Camellia lanceoleosa TaxID=1840588 RepID=A0ACC0GGP0_9ERIC|nr:Cysteine-rich receptor-like protein kinase 25 [Camellia lanceoleosa]